MKKMILVFVCMLGLATAVFAQNSQPKNEDIQAQRAAILEQVTGAAKEVGSGEEQIAKLKAIFENLFKKQDQIKADSTLTPDAKKEKQKEANSEKDWKVKNLMGEKYEAYAEVRKKLMNEANQKKQQQ